MRHTVALAASLLLLTGAARATDAPKIELNPTQQIFVVYETLCVKSGGKLEKAKPAIAKLEASNTIKALPAADAEKFFKKGTQAWATKTPAGTKIFVTYADNICGLHIEKADAKSLKDEFVHYVTNVSRGLKGTIVKKADNKVQGDSVFSYYIVAKPGAKVGAGFGLSTSAPEAKKLPQHLLTFNLAKPE